MDTKRIPPAGLQRTTFETSRAAEYFDARQLSTLTGVPQTEFASVCLKELVDNALDACETAGVAPQVGIDVRAEQDVIGLTVSDNGPGIPPEVVRSSTTTSASRIRPHTAPQPVAPRATRLRPSSAYLTL